MGIYRRWADGGFAVGPLLSGFVADACSIPAAVAVVATLTALSGIVVGVRMGSTITHSCPKCEIEGVRSPSALHEREDLHRVMSR